MINTVKNFLILPKNLPQMHIKLLQKTIQKTEEIGNLTGNKTEDKITVTPRTVSSKTKDVDLQIKYKYQEKDLYNQEKRQQFIDESRLI